MAKPKKEEALNGEVLPPSNGRNKRRGKGYDKPGQPPLNIDWDLVEKLLGIQCTQEEVAGVLGVSDKGLRDACLRDHMMTWREYARENLANGRASLRRKQWQVAMSGNARMLVFLGKQYLGQTDKNEVMQTERRRMDMNVSINVKKLSDKALREIVEAGEPEEGEEHA